MYVMLFAEKVKIKNYYNTLQRRQWHATPVPFLDSFVPTFAVTCLLIIMIIIIIITIIYMITWKVSFYF